MERAQRIIVQRALILVSAGLAAGVLYSFAPESHGFYPQCLFHSLTGLDCPGCGGLRAINRLLHGNFVEAFALNPLFVTALPLLIVMGVRETIGEALVCRRQWIAALIAATLLFGVLRNMQRFS